MASGFTDRFKGKLSTKTGDLWVDGVQVNTNGPDQNTQTGWGTVPISAVTTSPLQMSSARASGVEWIQPVATVGGAIVRLAKPITGGLKVLFYSTISGSTIIWYTASTDGSVVILGVGSTGSTASFAGTGGSTISNTIKSTQSCQIEIIGLSTTQWLFASVVPSSVGHLTFSTST